MSMISELVKELRNEAQEVRLCSNECESAELLYRAAYTIEMLSEKVRTDRPSAVDLSSVYSTAYRSGYEKGKADRPQGEWIVDISDYKSICPVCGAKETEFIYGTEMWYGLGESKFCPNCGARMKGENDE